MKNEHIEIESMLVELYLKNLSFLKTNFPKLFQTVEDLSHKIETNEYEEQYSLEISNGYLDIKNIENGGYYYAENSYVDAQERAKYNDFTLNSSWDLLRKRPDGTKLLKNKDFKDVLPVVDYINENVDLQNIEFREIMKMVFIGTGLGFHIDEIYKKLNPKTILIIEPELEIFRLSLFTIDYSVFTGNNKKLIFAIGENKEDRISAYSNFNSYQKYMNFHVKYYKLLRNYDYIKDELDQHFSKGGSIFFPYKKLLHNLHLTMSLIRDKEKFLDNRLTLSNNILKDKKILLISAGPSLEGYLDWIREHQEKFIIVCVDIMVRKLEKNKIIPDIVASIDPHDDLCSKFITTEDPDFLNNTALVFFAQQHEKTIEVVKDKNIYFLQSLPIFEEIGYVDSGRNVGIFGFILSYYLMGKEFYFIGNDASFNQSTGAAYSSNEFNNRIDNLAVKKDNNSLSVFDTIEVKGNLRDTVNTSRKLIFFRDDYERFFKVVSLESCNLHNLSDGAYIEGMVPVTKDEMNEKIQEFDDINKDNLLDEMNKVFVTMDDVDFTDDIKNINTMLRRITKYKKNKYKSRDDFLQNKLDLMIWILEKTKECKNMSVGMLFLQFTELADMHINFILNLRQKELHDKDEINKVSKFWIEGVYNLFKDIKNSIE